MDAHVYAPGWSPGDERRGVAGPWRPPAARRVVVNADDLGLHPAINEGIERGHRRGVVTSASLVACGQAFDDAVRRCRACPTLDVGVHLTLVDERPLSAAREIPTLATSDGRLPGSFRSFTARWLAGRIAGADVRREMIAQLERVFGAGLRPSHADSHQHVHTLPGVWQILMPLVQSYGIPYVRRPSFDSLWRGAQSAATPALRLGVNLLARARPRPEQPASADHVYGTSVSGHLTPAHLLSLLDCLPAGLSEIVVHPGVSDRDLQTRYRHWLPFSWQGDLDAVTSEAVVRTCAQGGIALVRFSDVTPVPASSAAPADRFSRCR